MRDLAALATLPSIWVECDLGHSLQNLTDVLRAALRASTVCLRVELPDGKQLDAAACAGLANGNGHTHDATRLLDSVAPGSTELTEIPKFNGSGALYALPQPIFFDGRQIGHFLACYREPVELSQSCQLLLHVAASQVMLLLQRHKDQEERLARQLAEERLRRTEHHYQQLVQSLPTAVYTCDIDGRITLYTEAAAKLWGRRPKLGEDKWSSFWNFFKPDGSPLPLEESPMAVAIREGRPIRGQQIVVQRPDGTRSFVLPHPDPIRDEAGRIIGTVNMLVVLDELKRTEQALRSSESRLQSLLNLMPAAVYACDAEGRITFFNRRAAELWGREPALNADHQKFCAVYRCWFKGNVLAPEDTPMAVAVREGKSFRNLEPIFERPDGVRVPVLVNIDPILDANGNPAGAINVFQDVTALKSAEAELKRKNSQLAAFLETAALGLHRVGPDGIIQWANAAEMAMLGYAPEEYIGHHIAKFHADQPVIDDILKRLNGGEILCEREARLRCKNGSIKHVLIDSSVLWEDGKFIHTQCFTRDVTEQKRAEEMAARLAAIVQHSDDAIFSTDLDGVIKSWNLGAQRLYGYTPAEAVGQQVSILIPEDLRSEQSECLAHVRQGRPIENLETMRRKKDGTVFNVSLTVSPVKDARGNVIGVSKVARDITDKVRAKEKLEKTVAQRTAQLCDTVAELEAFSYSVAHDMRAPLRAMNSYSRILETDFAPALPDQARDFTRRIAAGAQRLDALITDVLNYSRIARSELPLDKVDVEKLTRDIVESYPNVKESAATILIQSPIPPVLGNTAALTQCISNIITNAIKFVRPGSTPRVIIRADHNSECVRLWFEDNGIGISEEGQKRIFRLFQRLNPARDFEGNGIGLTIVRKAVERMGGRVGVQSQLGVGSQFWLELKGAP
jgi:PAS domain S-box-containing protein